MVYVLVHGNHCFEKFWTFRWFFSLLFQIYRVHVVDSAHHLLNIKWKIRPFCFRLSNIECIWIAKYYLSSPPCWRHIGEKDEKEPPQAPPTIRYRCIPFCTAVKFGDVTTYVWIPLILVPPIFDFCVYHYCSFLPFTPTIVCNKRLGQYITIHS